MWQYYNLSHSSPLFLWDFYPLMTSHKRIFKLLCVGYFVGCNVNQLGRWPQLGWDSRPFGLEIPPRILTVVRDSPQDLFCEPMPHRLSYRGFYPLASASKSSKPTNYLSQLTVMQQPITLVTLYYTTNWLSFHCIAKDKLLTPITLHCNTT